MKCFTLYSGECFTDECLPVSWDGKCVIAMAIKHVHCEQISDSENSNRNLMSERVVILRGKLGSTCFSSIVYAI